MLRLAPLLLLLLAACAPEQPADRPAEHTPPPEYDLTALITASTSEAALRERLGAEARPDSVYVGEGFYEPGTVLYPDDPPRRLSVLWQDEARTRPAVAFTPEPESVWTAGGVGMGASMEALERLNGGPFELMGFGWDYGGTVSSWQGGALEAVAPGATLLVRLSAGDADFEQIVDVLGDAVFPSTHPAFEQIDPRVYYFGLSFDR